MSLLMMNTASCEGIKIYFGNFDFNFKKVI